LTDCCCFHTVWAISGRSRPKKNPAEAAAKLLPKGARIFARGQLVNETWTDNQGEPHAELRLDADYLTVDLLCVDTLTVRVKSDEPDEGSE